VTIHFQDDVVTLHHGDCLEVLRELPDASVDAVVTDPPYGISFMGKAWDQPGEYGSKSRRGGGPNLRRGAQDAALEAGRYDLSPHAMSSFQRWCEAWAAECLRILRPGGHLIAFGGARTWHRLAAGVEDAGFEVRDSIAWLFGSGFPKSLNVGKAIDRTRCIQADTHSDEHDHICPKHIDAEPWRGHGTATKPAFEPIVVARKPLAGTVAANVLAHGTGALNIDGCRRATDDDLNGGAYAKVGGRSESASLRAGSGMNVPGKTVAKDFEQPSGRWPTNVVLDDTQAAELDRQSGTLTSGVLAAHHTRAPKEAGILGAYGSAEGERGYGDSGGASRFFPTFRYEAKAPTSERPRAGEVAHPTVKPLDLMRWLVRLVTPPGGTVLEPFAGSGTTAEACVIEGFQCIAIEREADYLPLIVGRLTKPIPMVLDLGEAR